MIEARRRLIGCAREMFQGHLLGIIDWSAVKVEAPVPSLPIEDDRRPGRMKRNPIRFKEYCVLRFDVFTLEVSSPHEAPPLGQIRLSKGTNLLVEGTLDSSVWGQAAQAIRENRNGDR